MTEKLPYKSANQRFLPSGRWIDSTAASPISRFAGALPARPDEEAGLDENCGADGWAMTPSGTHGVLNDALSIYFGDATLAGAFVARWCVGTKVETAGGVFQVRDDQPEPWVRSGLHRTP